MDFIPIVGQLKAAEQMWSGKDLLTGSPMSTASAAVGLMPGGKSISTAFKWLGKAAGSKVGLLGSKTAAVEEMVHTVPNKKAQRMHIEANIAQTRLELKVA